MIIKNITDEELNPPISAEDYKIIINALYHNMTKIQICERLDIARPTHDRWLKHGVTNTKHVSNIREKVSLNINLLRWRTRVLDQWTTSNKVKEIKRITHIT